MNDLSKTEILKWVDPARLIPNLAAALVGLLALLAFALSYSSLHHVAASNGVGEWLAYAWPLLLDFAMVVFSLAILRANLRGERAIYPWALTIVFAALAIAANVLDAGAVSLPKVVVAGAVKALAPVALVLAFELLMGMIRSEVKRSRELTNLTELIAQASTTRQELGDLTAQRDQVAGEVKTVTAERERLEASVAALAKERDRLLKEREVPANDSPASSFIPGDHEALARANEVRAAEASERRATVARMLSEKMSCPAIAEALGVSVSTVRRDKAALGNGKVHDE